MFVGGYGEKEQLQVAVCKTKIFCVLHAIKTEVANSSLHLPSSFDEGYTRTEGGGDVSEKHRS